MDFADSRSIKFLNSAPRFYIAIINSPLVGELKSFIIKKYLKGNEGIFGRGNPGTIEEFRQLFSDGLKELQNEEVQTIIDTTIVRIRNWAQIIQLAESGWEYMEVINGANACNDCRQRKEARIRISSAVNRINEFLVMDAVMFLQAMKQKMDFPPFHDGCHCRVGVSY